MQCRGTAGDTDRMTRAEVRGKGFLEPLHVLAGCQEHASAHLDQTRDVFLVKIVPVELNLHAVSPLSAFRAAAHRFAVRQPAAWRP